MTASIWRACELSLNRINVPAEYWRRTECLYAVVDQAMESLYKRR